MPTKQAITVITAPTRAQFTEGIQGVLDEPNSRIITISHHVTVYQDTIQYSAVILREDASQEND